MLSNRMEGIEASVEFVGLSEGAIEST